MHSLRNKTDSLTGLIGAGSLARALARGWAEPVICSDGGSGRAVALVSEVGGETSPSNRAVAEKADVVVLLHHRDQLKAVADDVRDAARIVVSALGRTTQAEVQAAYPSAEVLRVVPNLAVEIRRGVTLVAAPRRGVGDATDAMVRSLFSRVGRVVEVPESLIAVAVACSGVGPAFWARIVEEWKCAAISRGLPERVAAELVIETMSGSAALLADWRGDTARVERAVATPGGSTARGLAALGELGLADVIEAAVEAVVCAYEAT